MKACHHDKSRSSLNARLHEENLCIVGRWARFEKALIEVQR